MRILLNNHESMFSKGTEVIPSDKKRRKQNRLASLPEMRRQNKDADTSTYGIGGFSSILSEVQIHLRDPLQGWENRRKQNARRLGAVRSDPIRRTASLTFKTNQERKQLI